MAIVAFGEIMARIAPPERRRWRQALPGMVEVTWGGGEANACVALALWGHPVRFITALPQHPLADALVATLRATGIDTRYIIRRAGRLGLYFVECGANQRGSSVLYDRQYSAVSLAEAEEFPFDEALTDARWVHLTGITPAISEQAFRAACKLTQLAHQRQITVSCDLNFRKKLWTWSPGETPHQLARRCMPEILQFAQLIIGNEEDAEDVLGIRAAGSDVQTGRLDISGYADVARQVAERFPNARYVAITLRESLSADYNRWGALLWDARHQEIYFAPTDAQGQYCPYEIRDIVDRIGAGDCFAAGLIHGWTTWPDDPQRTLSFATAASCLKHSIHGDFAYVERSEVEALLQGTGSGRVQR